jgi:hypothetical protein
MSINNELIKLDRIQNLLSNIGNKIIENKTLMRCLQYDSADVLSQPEVTMSQIKNLVGKGSDPSNQQKLFKMPFYNDTISDPRTELRFFIPIFEPNNIYLTNVDVAFQIIIHNTKWDLDDNFIKPIVMINEILKDFNGQDLGGIGVLQLKSSIKVVNWNKSFSGYTFYLSTRSA